MRRLNVLLCTFILACLCSVALAAELDLAKFMPVDEIRPGMAGIGKTVFHGTKIEDFQVEVLDISKNANGPKADIIWVLCSGGPLAETGVMQGMSGSPIYIDGRMIGALAYSLGTFSKRPIAGITPIADMLDMLERERSATEHSMLDTRHMETISSFLASNSESSVERPTSSIQDTSASVTPLQTPIMVSGFHPKTIEDMAPVFKKLGMNLIQGGGTSSEEISDDVLLQPGAIVGVQFTRGDSSAFGYGTVTHIQDGKILAFGHPMDGLGKTSLPMAGGRVGLLAPSLLISSKRAAPVKIVGTMTYDSQYGIMGAVGREPEFIPIRIRINSQEYNFEVAENWLVSPLYIRMTVLNAIYSMAKSVGDYTMRTHLEIKLKGYPTISKNNVFSGRSPGVVASALTKSFYSIMQSKFERVDMENILLEITLEDKRASAAIDEIRIDKDRVRPGDSVMATVFITPYMEDTVTKKIEVAIPKDTPEGPTFLIISDARASTSWEKSRAPAKAQIMDMPHLLKTIQEEESNSDIIVDLFAPKVGVTIRDQELPALPLTTFDVMSSRKQIGDNGFTRGTTFSKQRIHTDYVVSGSAMMFLIIDRDAP